MMTINIEPLLDNKTLQTMLQIGMKLEMQSKMAKDMMLIATIKDIKKDTVIIFIDGNDESDNDIQTDFSNNDLHPIGFSENLGFKLYKNEELQKNFSWLDYIVETMSKPVPYEIFAKQQTLSTKKNQAFFVLDEMDVLLFKCGDTIRENNCIFRTSRQSLDTNTVATKLYQSTSDSEKMFTFAFGLLPQIQTDKDLLFPQHRLANNLEVDKLNILTFAINCDHLTPTFDTYQRANREDILAEMNVNLTLLPGCINPMTGVIKKKEEDPVGHTFLRNSRHELLYGLILLCRSKFQTTVSLNNFFPSINIDERLGCENISRYLLIYMYTLSVMCGDEKKDEQEQDQSKDNENEKIGMEEQYKTLLCSFAKKEYLKNILPRIVSINKNDDVEEVVGKQAKLFQDKLVVSLLVQKIPKFANYSTILDRFASLSEISFTNCQLETFVVDDLSTLSRTLLRLNLSFNPLKVIPVSVFQMKNLRELRIAACGIKNAFPIELLQLSKLALLDVSYNFCTEVPNHLVRLKQLKYLFLAAVPCINSEVLPITIETFTEYCQSFHLTLFKNLTEANVSEKVAELTKIKTFATTPVNNEDELSALNAVIVEQAPRFESSASTNKTELGHGFPLQLCQLKNVKVLDLSGHNMSQIPAELESMNNLNELILIGCQYLEEITEKVARLPLTDLKLERCLALKNPPLETVDKGFDRIIGHFRRLIAGNADCKRTKLMVVGLGGAGKSTLVQKLIGKDTIYYGWQQQDVTDGIDITEYSWVTEEETIIFSIWDFAGQSVYYHTHQFFLSNRAIYLLLWNSRLGYEHSGLDFWLSSISCHAPEAPIFIVATFADQIDKISLPKDQLQKSYPQIVSFERVSSVTGLGITEFRDRLGKVSASQGYMNSQVPAVYLQLEMFILEKRPDMSVMNFADIQKHAKNIGVVETSEVRSALKFLHELGSIQYFPNEFLRDRIIINPQWLVDVMACIVTVKESAIHNGTFIKRDIDVIWANYPQDLRHWLLKLTEEFDLTFQLMSEEIHIIPCLLPEEEPKFHWPKIKDKKTKETRMTYKFDYLPGGLFNRIQARLCQFSVGSKIWKNGSFLHKNNHLALIRQNREKELVVLVQGHRPENILFLVHEVVDNIINESFRGVRYELLVPCPECVKVNSTEPHMFSNKVLAKAIEFKAPMLQCTNLFHICPLTSLHSLLPPTSLMDYEENLMETIQEMKNLKSTVSKDVCLLVCDQNVRQPNQICPTKICDDLLSNQIRSAILKPSKEMKIDDLVAQLVNAKLLIVCISNEFCANQICTDLLTYVRQTNKSLLFVVVGSGNEWKSTNAGLLLGSDFYIDFQKRDVYKNKMKELMQRINELKSQKEAEPVSFPQVFFSYSWDNSQDAVAKGRKSDEFALGEVDPREICEFLTKNNVHCWIDTKMKKGQKPLFEEIAEALRNARLIVTCVSDEYLESQNCLREFHFAIGTLKLPSIMCVVGRGNKWEESELTLLAYKSPRIDFRTKSSVSMQTLLDTVRQILARTHRKSVVETSDKNSEQSDPQNDYEAYKEVCQLAQRRFVEQLSRISAKLRTMDEMFKTPYPRLIFLDYVKNDDRKMEINNKESLSEFSRSDLCIKLLCEYEEGWHTVGIPLKLASDNYLNGMEEITNKLACYLTQLYNILQHSTETVECMKLPHAEKIMADLKSRANETGLQSLEESYKFMSELARKSDTDMLSGQMQRYSLFSRKTVWLCAEHGKMSRGMVSDDVADFDDVIVSLENKPGQNKEVNGDVTADSRLNSNEENVDGTRNSTDGSVKSADSKRWKKIRQKSRMCNMM